MLLFASSIYIVVMTLLHERLHAYAHRVDASVYAIESIVTAITGSLFWGEGKEALASTYFAASAGFAIALVVMLVKGGRHASGRPEEH